MVPGHTDPLGISIKARRDATDPLFILVHLRIRTSFFFGLGSRSFRSLESNGRERRDKVQRTCQDSKQGVGELHDDWRKNRRQCSDGQDQCCIRVEDLANSKGGGIYIQHKPKLISIS